MDDMFAKLAMLLVLGATTPIGEDMTVWGQWGLAGAVVAYTLYRDFHREKRLARSLETQQRWLRDTLMTALNKNSDALNRVARLLKENNKK
ncbi:MAG: hypothetical protein HRU15_09765 [Planctomycetes bacterium]|nr:hypothetical protein [Planctomycetota bacterium]